MKKTIIFLTALIVAIGCASTATKYEQLSERVDKFNKAVYWGMLPQAMAFVEGDNQQVLRQDLRRRIRSEKTVDMQVEEVSIDEEGDSAEVSVVTRYYQSPSYTVMERREEQLWNYSALGSGWTLTSNRAVSGSSPATLPDPSGSMR